MKRNSEVRFIYVGTALPYDDFLNVRTANAAGNLAERGLIEALKTSGASLDHVISFWPISPFPIGRTLFKMGKVAEVVPGVSTRFFPLVNIYPFRNLIRYAFLFFYLLAWRICRIRCKCMVVMYNLAFPNPLYLRSITWLMGVKLASLILDAHGIASFRRPWYKTLLEPLWFLQLSYSMIRKLDGRMVITENIAKDFAPGLSHMVLDGGITQQVVDRLFPLEPLVHDEFIIFFAGSIHPIEHIDVLLAYMKRNNDPSLRLWLAGNLEYHQVLEASRQDSRIVYKGLLKLKDLVECYKQIDVLVCLRDTKDQALKYHYPAKTLECLAVGKPYITTNTGHTRKDYGDLCEVLDEPTLEAFEGAVSKIRAMTPEERVSYGKKARDFMLRERTWAARGKAIRQYLEGVANK